MYGAIAGDIIGAPYEGHHRGIKTEDFPLFSPYSRFTDDTVLTIAVADTILHRTDYAQSLNRYAQRYPNASYGHGFKSWLAQGDLKPYSSFGNGSAMRVSPVGWAFDTVERVLSEAERSAAVTHNHPEGIKGAQAVALAIFLARTGSSKEHIRSEISGRFGYNLARPLAEIRPIYTFDATCPGSVPESIIAFLESTGVEDAMRKAVSLGGDSDTMACIAGAIGEAFYGGVPAEIRERVRGCLPGEFLEVVDDFRLKFRLP
jgi:ADP-ribosylglycohydrolase